MFTLIMHDPSCSPSLDDFGLGMLLQTHQIKRFVCSFIGSCKELEKQYLAGDVEVVLAPQVSSGKDLVPTTVLISGLTLVAAL